MHGNIKYRVKREKDKKQNAGSFINRRPRSWGEFQSNSAQFHKFDRSRKSSDFSDDRAQSHVTEEEMKPHPEQIDAVPPSNPAVVRRNPTPNWKLKARPRSAVSYVTPFYKPFRPAIKSPILSMTSTFHSDVIGSENNIADPQSLESEEDPQSVLFENTLENVEPHVGAEEQEPVTPVSASGKDYLSSSSADIGNSDQLTNYDEKTSQAECVQPGALTASQRSLSPKRDVDCKVDSTEALPQCNKSAIEGIDTFNENERTCSYESIDSALCVSEVAPSTIATADNNFNTDCTDDSDVISVHSTGFFSLENTGHDFPTESNRQLDQINSKEEEMPNPAPRKSKSGGALPKRINYNQSMFTAANFRGTSSKSSISSLELSDDESGTRNGYGSNNSQDKLQSPTHYSSLKRYKASGITSSSKADSSTDSADSGYTKGETEPRTIHVKDYITPLQTTSTESLKWKPGKFKQQKSQTNDTKEPKPRSSDTKQPQPSVTKLPKNTNGTWPRRAHANKRQKEQEEAEELLKRFRQTSENYRNRFRNIFTDTRRRTEEAMFGLRITMAKNGYSAPCYQPKSYSHTHSNRSIVA